MDGLAHDDQIGGGLSRREALKRGGIVVGAAALWTTPVVQTLGAKPAAASTVEPADFCPDDSGDPPIWAVWRFAPDGTKEADEALEGSIGGTAALEGSTADITIDPAEGNWKPGPQKYCGIEPGDLLLIEAPSKKSLTPRLEFTIKWSKDTESGTESSSVHTSCSSPLNIEDRFGSVVLHAASDGTKTKGEKVGKSPGDGCSD